MKKFYLTRLEKKSPAERQAYLDEVVVEKYRDEVREEWNATHPAKGMQLK